MSSEAIVLTGPGAGSYDFTMSPEKYYGDKMHVELSTGIWGMISGDADGNGIVNVNDKNLNWIPQSGKKGYKSSDFNLNTQVENNDKNDYWRINLNRESQIPQ
ncbi:MAG: hypothetical protein R2764_07205 [Bacteroidales bacterium]